ncbi:MAG: Hpt domain-containing protein [Rubrivivax sp.]|nr:Hpt domain-containing protein [Rubrivivax sp.]
MPTDVTPSAPGSCSSGSGDPPSLDPVALEQLRLLDPTGAANIVVRVLETYQRSLTRSMQEAQAARAAGDHSTLGRLTHTLRSSSASVGALQFSALCKEIEALVREGRTGELESRLDALQDESVRVQAALAAMLSPRGSAA